MLLLVPPPVPSSLAAHVFFSCFLMPLLDAYPGCRPFWMLRLVLPFLILLLATAPVPFPGNASALVLMPTYAFPSAACLLLWCTQCATRCYWVAVQWGSLAVWLLPHLGQGSPVSLRHPSPVLALPDKAVSFAQGMRGGAPRRGNCAHISGRKLGGEGHGESCSCLHGLPLLPRFPFRHRRFVTTNPCVHLCFRARSCRRLLSFPFLLF